MKRLNSAAIVAGLGLLFAPIGIAGTPAPSTSAGGPPTLYVFAGASLTDAFTVLGHRLERQRPGLRVRFNFAGSQQLALQIEQGAAADVFASADEHWMSHVRDHHLLAGESEVFARNRLVVIVPRQNPAGIHRLQDLARDGVKLVLGAAAVPVGEYSRRALQKLARDPAFGREFSTRVLRNVVSEEENVKSVLAKVRLGEADAGVVYRSDLGPSVARLVRVFEIPEYANVLASYPISRLKSTKESEAGAAFVALVLSPEGQQVLQRSGLIPVRPTRR